MTDTPPPGRPRDPAIDEAVRRAVAELLAEGGRPAVTVEAVAERAGTSRASIYRRYRDAEHLLLSVLLELLNDEAGPRGTARGMTGRDLVARLLMDAERTFAELDEAGVGPALFSSLASDPTLGEQFRERFYDRVKGPLTDRVAQQVGDELAGHVDPSTLLDLLAALPHYLRYVLHQPLQPADVDRVVDLLWRGIAPPGRADPADGSSAWP